MIPLDISPDGNSRERSPRHYARYRTRTGWTQNGYVVEMEIEFSHGNRFALGRPASPFSDSERS